MNFAEFKNPSKEYRNAPFWSWNDHLHKDELTRQVREMADKGWGGFFMHSRVGLVTEYMGQEWMELVKGCVDEAGKTGIGAWLYDEDKWPSGFAGGLIPNQDEKFRSRALVLIKKDQITKLHTVLHECEYENDKCYICKFISPLNDKWFNGASYVDLMNPDTTKAFLESTHEKYKEIFSENFGKEIPGIFTDEPCYLMASHYNAPVLPWSEVLPETFLEENGYSILDYLPELFFDSGNYRKIRFDFYKTVTQLFVANFTKIYFDWCENNNLKLTGHMMAEETPVSQTRWIGAAMPHYEHMHWPGIDKLYKNINQLVAVKQLTSVSDQLGKEHAMSESFGCVGQDVSFFHRKWIGDWQAALGINFVNSHLSLYSMRGERKRDYPANLFFQQPWWDMEKPYADYTARLCNSLSQGKRIVEILVLHPLHSCWCEYSPLHSRNNYMIEENIYTKPFENLCKQLMAENLDFHLGDEDILRKHGKIADGKFIVGNNEYTYVVVPPMLNLDSSTLKLLEKFQQEGHSENLLFFGQIPFLVDGLINENNIKVSNNYFKTPEEVVYNLLIRDNKRTFTIDRISGTNSKDVFVHRRKTADGKLSFFANTNKDREVDLCCSVPGNKEDNLYLLDLMSGDVFLFENKYTSGRFEWNCRLHPAGSMLVYLTSEKIDNIPMFQTISSGVEFIENVCNGQKITDWSVKLTEENVLPIHYVTAYIDGEKVIEDGFVSKAWNDYFYPAKNGTEFIAEYNFYVDSVPLGQTYCVIECAENLEYIYVNDIRVKALKSSGERGEFDCTKSWKDISFTKVPLGDNIRAGKNIIRIEGKKVNNILGPNFHEKVKDYKNHKPTELESIYIIGDFEVSTNNYKDYFITKKKANIDICDITESGFPFYCGKIILENKFHVKENKKISLRLNKFKGACAKVYINDECAGNLYWEPYVLDISNLIKPGENDIKIILSNTLFNITGPNWISNILEQDDVSPYLSRSYDCFTRYHQIMSYGLKSVVLCEI